MRRFVLLALLFAGCSKERAAPDSSNVQVAENHGPEQLLLRVPRAGGTGRVYRYPNLDSAVWVVDEVPSVEKVLGFVVAEPAECVHRVHRLRTRTEHAQLALRIDRVLLRRPASRIVGRP